VLKRFLSIMTQIIFTNPVAVWLTGFFERKTISYRIIFSISFVFILALIAIYAQQQISKGADFHYLNYKHLKFSNEYAQELTKLRQTNGGSYSALEAALANVKAQPLECLEVINFMDRAVMWMIGTDTAIDLCERDLVFTERAETAIANLKSGRSGWDQAEKELTVAGDIFYQNSLEFDAPVVKTVEFIIAMMGGMTIFVALLLVTILLYSLQSIRKSLTDLGGHAEGLAAGSHSEIPIIGREDDTLGILSRSLEKFRLAAMERTELEEKSRKALEDQMTAEKAAEEEQAKARALEQEREREARERQTVRSEKIEAVITGFETATAAQFSELADLSGQLGGQASALTEIANETRGAVEEAGRATDSSAHNVQAIASASEELTSSFNEINNQMNSTSEVIGNSVRDITGARDRVQALSDGAMNISRVVELISDIAEQTNLLALNATIEAARAGDAGKGFAVVASEVKSLASQTADATTEIENQINVLQSSGQEATKAMNEISDTFASVEDMANQVSGSVSEQTAATSEITQNISATASATDELRTNMQVVQQNSTNTDESAQTVTQTSQGISTLANDLQREFEAFMGKVRSL